MTKTAAQAVLVIVAVYVLLFNAGCNRLPSGSQPPSTKAPMAKVLSPELQMDATQRRKALSEKLGWNNLPDEGTSHSLPADLTGITFYGEEGTQVNFRSNTEVSVTLPGGQAPLIGAYEVGTPSEFATLVITFPAAKDGGQATYTVLRSGRKITITQQGVGNSVLPIVLRGTLSQ